MTDTQRNQIKQMRINGKSYSRIAEQLGLSVNTVKSYGRRINLKIKTEVETAPKVLDKRQYIHCKNCGKLLQHKNKCKPKKFCSSECRQEWWKHNTVKINKQSTYYLVCEHCGITFESYGNRNRKFCSHECYIESRFGTKECDHTI